VELELVGEEGRGPDEESEDEEELSVAILLHEDSPFVVGSLLVAKVTQLEEGRFWWLGECSDC